VQVLRSAAKHSCSIGMETPLTGQHLYVAGTPSSLRGECGLPIEARGEFHTHEEDDDSPRREKSRPCRKRRDAARRKNVTVGKGMEPFSEELSHVDGQYMQNVSPVDRHHPSKKRLKLYFDPKPKVMEQEELESKKENEVKKKSIQDVIKMTGGVVLKFMEPDTAAFLVNELKVFPEDGPIWRYLLKDMLLRGRIPFRVGPNVNYREAFDRRFNEVSFIADHGWLDKHRTLRRSFFPILCNWLVELHFELFGDHSRKLMCRSPLNPIHLAMKYLFRFLSSKPSITSNRLQLVGVSCYQIAVDYDLGKRETAKLDLDASRYAYYTDNAYTAEEVTEMTANIQKTLCVGRMYTPRDPLYVLTPTEALKTLLREIGLDSNILVVLFANYLVDLSMHDTTFSEILPAQVAAAAVLFACKRATLDCDSKITQRILDSCYKQKISDLSLTAEAMEKLYDGACKQETGTSIFNNHVLPKYSMVIKHYSTKFMEWIQGKLSPSYRKSLFK